MFSTIVAMYEVDVMSREILMFFYSIFLLSFCIRKNKETYFEAIMKVSAFPKASYFKLNLYFVFMTPLRAVTSPRDAGTPASRPAESHAVAWLGSLRAARSYQQ